MAGGTVLYIHDKGAVGVRVEGSAKKPKVVRASELSFELPQPGEDGLPPDPDAVLETKAIQLRAWMRKSKLASGDIALCADPNSVILRDLRLAFVERRQIDKVIAFQVEGVIPSVAIEDLAVGYTVLEKDSEGSRLLVVAAHRAALQKSLDLLEQAGFTASIADCTVGGALNLRQYRPDLANATKPTLWIDLQGEHALIAVLDGPTILNLRSIRVPAAALSEMQAAALQDAAHRVATGVIEDDVPLVLEEEEEHLDRTHAPEKKKSTDSQPPRRLTPGGEGMTGIYAYAKEPPKADALSQVLVLEVRRSILGAQAQGAIQRVAVSGVPESLREVVDDIQAQLGVEQLEIVDLTEKMIPRDRKGIPRVSLPPSLLVPTLAGIGCKMTGADASGVDFLTGDLSPTDTFDKVKNPLAIGVTLLFLIVGVMLMLVWKQRQDLLRDAKSLLSEERLRRAHATAYQDAAEGRKRKFPEGETDPFTLVAAVSDQMVGDYNEIKRGNKRSFPPIFEADRVLNEVLIRVQEVLGDVQKAGGKNTEHFYLRSFDFRQNPPRQGATGPTRGELIIEAYIETAPDTNRRYAFSDALEAIEVANPLWDGKDKANEKIKVFAQVVPDADMSKSIRRGEKKVNGKAMDIQMTRFTFRCVLTELQRKAPAAKGGTTSGGEK